jgi:hypothetical protein
MEKAPFSRATDRFQGFLEAQLQVFDEQVQKHLAVHGGLEDGPGSSSSLLK